MFGRLIVIAGVVALLSAAPGTAQVSQPQGVNSQEGQSDQVLRKKKKLMQPGAPAGQAVQAQPQKHRPTAVQQGQMDQGQTVKNKKMTKRQLIQRNRHQGSATAQQGQNTTQMSKKKVGQTQVGQARAGKTVTKTTLIEKKSVIRRKLVTTRVQRVSRTVIKRVSIGVRVPRTVRFYPLPREVIQFVPEYEGFLYFVLDDGRIVIVDPNTYEIVYIL